MKLIATILLVLSFGASAGADNSIDKEAVRKVIKNNLPLFQKCYADELKNDPKIKGKVVLSWDISDTGEVKTATIKSSALKNKTAEECIVATVKALKFPEAPQGTFANINFPFVFGKN